MLRYAHCEWEGVHPQYNISNMKWHEVKNIYTSRRYELGNTGDNWLYSVACKQAMKTSGIWMTSADISSDISAFRQKR